MILALLPVEFDAASQQPVSAASSCVVFPRHRSCEKCDVRRMERVENIYRVSSGAISSEKIQLTTAEASMIPYFINFSVATTISC